LNETSGPGGKADLFSLATERNLNLPQLWPESYLRNNSGAGADNSNIAGGQLSCGTHIVMQESLRHHPCYQNLGYQNLAPGLLIEG